MFLAAVAMKTNRIKLGTGVVSLPYHHPFHVAQRAVQLDQMSMGRAILGTGPGALPSDAHTLGIDPMVLRDRQDEAIGVIKKLLAGEERVSYECEWFKLNDAKLQILPIQDEIPMATASMISPSGMTLAGKFGDGVLSIGSTSTEGIQSLPLQWSFAEESASANDQSVDRRNWRIVMMWHIAETREEAYEQVDHGLVRWHNDYNVGTLQRPGAVPYATTDEAIEAMSVGEHAPAVIGTPDDLVKQIMSMYEVTGGYGVVIGFVHDWVRPEFISKSWDLTARYVIPEVNGQLAALRESNKFVIENREYFNRAGEAIASKIMENDRAAEAFKVTMHNRAAMTTHAPPTQDAD